MTSGQLSEPLTLYIADRYPEKWSYKKFYGYVYCVFCSKRKTNVRDHKQPVDGTISCYAYKTEAGQVITLKFYTQVMEC